MLLFKKIFFSRKEKNYIFNSVYYINYTAGRLFITDTKESYNYNLIEPINVFLRKKKYDQMIIALDEIYKKSEIDISYIYNKSVLFVSNSYSKHNHYCCYNYNIRSWFDKRTI